MNKRKALSKRTRFEIMKRDGFACRYCGRSPAAAPLHVDHVISVAEGGTDGPENLVTACQDCNLGKSSVPLNSIRAGGGGPGSLRLQKEHARQIAAFLAYEKAIQAERDKVTAHLWGEWVKYIGPMSADMYRRLGRLHLSDPVPALVEAMLITGAARGTPGEEYDYYVAVGQQRYFSAVMRNWRTYGRFGVWS